MKYLWNGNIEEIKDENNKYRYGYDVLTRLIKVEGTNRKLRDIDTDLSNVMTLNSTKITVPVKLWQNSKPHEAFGKQTIIFLL